MFCERPCRHNDSLKDASFKRRISADARQEIEEIG
jgi:hypothetical protein